MTENHSSAQGDGYKLDVERAVADRYSSASKLVEASLCCPVQYDPKLLEVLPQELIQRDYGCGDPSRYVKPGETVLDLGSGGGKVCYIASQIVGPEGKVIGIDMNDDMLQLARQYQPEIAARIGHDNVHFHKGRIQDLALDLDVFADYLRDQPVSSSVDWLRANAQADRLRRSQPMVANDSVDVIVSNCVLNLVDPTARQQLFAEMFRVLKRSGRAVISDIVCDEHVPQRLKDDPALWSGCISGAFVEGEFLDAFADTGFYGMELVDRPRDPWATVEGIEFRSVTVRAFKGKQGPSVDYKQAVIYQGPWKSVMDDDGHTLRRGVPTAVCGKTYRIYNRAPYKDQIVPVPPREPVKPEQAKPFEWRRNVVRDPRETKGEGFSETNLPADSCCGDDGCC